MNLFKDTLANAIAALRSNPNQFASSTGMTRGQLSKFLAGPDLPKSETLVTMCDALPPDHAARLVKAWIFGRVGAKYAASVLTAAAGEEGHPLQVLLDSLPAETSAAFLTLITTARDDEDFRSSMIHLAACLRGVKDEERFSGANEQEPFRKAGCATTAILPDISPKLKKNQVTASIATLPAPPVLASLIHDTMAAEQPASSPVPEKRTETTYAPKRKAKQ